MKLKTIVIVFSVLGVILLYVLSLFSQPIPVALSEVSQHEGKRICVTGMVLSHRVTSTGSELIEIQNQNMTAANSTVVTLYVEEETQVGFGDIIRVTGKVQNYKGTWEIVVSAANEIQILQSTSTLCVPLRQLALAPERYIDLPLNVSGVVDVLGDGCFSLVDDRGEYMLSVVCSSSVISGVGLGAPLVVSGRLKYESEGFRYVFSASSVFSGGQDDWVG
ncbi:MAG: hypothetical protein V1726_06895 [Methanobacteriota archaeon]